MINLTVLNIYRHRGVAISENNPIEDFISKKVLPEYRGIFEKFRIIMKTKYPNILKEMRGGTDKYNGVPVYRKRKIIISVSPTKKELHFHFQKERNLMIYIKN